MFGDGLLVDTFVDFFVDNIDEFEDSPFVFAFGFGEKVEENDIVEFQPFGFVDGKAQGVLEN